MIISDPQSIVASPGSRRQDVLYSYIIILLPSYEIIFCMRDASYFTRPVSEWQRRYEALRASFVDRLPAYIVAERFGFSAGYVRLLR